MIDHAYHSTDSGGTRGLHLHPGPTSGASPASPAWGGPREREVLAGIVAAGFGADLAIADVAVMAAGDFETSDRLFVLQLAERVASPEPTAGEHLALSEKQRYRAMRRDVPLPPDLEPLIVSPALHQLHTIPDTWIFDPDGHWIGWREAP